MAAQTSRFPSDLTNAKDAVWHIAQADALLQASMRTADSSSVPVAEAAVRNADRATAHALTAIALELRRHNVTQEELLT